jgi:hypothetical protein
MRDHGNNLATEQSGDGKIWRRKNLATEKSGDGKIWRPGRVALGSASVQRIAV